MASKKQQPSSVLEKARKSVKSVRKDAQKAARKRAKNLVLNAIDFQKNAFNSTIDVIGKGQDRAGEGLEKLARNAKWMPAEGREVIDVWNGATRKSRKEFKMTVNKSYDLMSRYIKGGKPPKSAASKRTAAKVKTGPRKKTTTGKRRTAAAGA